ncbi:hypothetical protein IE81DRAFT_364318 [Ceraceosorus guamensis]|uniref:DUF1275 domain protein n=1 Tax=Ceraceosorus guamensis TaxID=1522189 RepID=A0A316W865_9BASI|nr:hypothetical protein IE81DRAFT_364318 [Ceraceosorus guamensis]PWN45308.1 hypothetical protein IE81DRAFT_364318 [Ceraceosorus guamensis]
MPSAAPNPTAIPSDPVRGAHGEVQETPQAIKDQIRGSSNTLEAVGPASKASSSKDGHQSPNTLLNNGPRTGADSPEVGKEGADSGPVQEPGQAVGRGGAGNLTRRMTRLLNQQISHDAASVPLAWMALLTGMVDALVYSRSQVWTGFQTGNMVQFSQNIAQWMLPQAEKFPLLTLERVLSILSFLLGSFLGALGGRRFGDRRRAWQVTTALIQSISLWGAAGILLSRPEDEAPSFRYYPGVIVLTAFSMGLQSISAQKLVSPAFATTVAFTATLTQIASDPYLFALTLSPFEAHRQRAKNDPGSASANGASSGAPKAPATTGRDRRLLAIFALCTGAGVAEMLLYSDAGLRGGMAIAAGFKLVLAALWLIPQGQDPKPKAEVGGA